MGDMVSPGMGIRANNFGEPKDEQLSNAPNPLPGVPVVESPFFDELFKPEQYDAETYRIARDLREKGFAIFDFPDVDIREVTERIKAEMHDTYDWASYRAGNNPDMRVQDAWLRNEDVRRIATNEATRRLLSTIYGREAFPFQTLTFAVGTQQHFHSDSIHFSSMPERFMCGVWVAFEDIGPDQGPLVYYPGSHKWPIITNEHCGHTHMARMATSQNNYDTIQERLVKAYGVEPERFTPKAGQALIWAANLLHGGDVHTNRNKSRWSQVTHYYFEDCCYYTPMYSDEPFGSIYFREPYNILTGENVKNRYHGVELSQDYLKAATPKHAAEVWASNQLPSNFNKEAYLAANPDVAASDIGPARHYLEFGRQEQRPLFLAK
jgi:hypothetical protein